MTCFSIDIEIVSCQTSALAGSEKHSLLLCKPPPDRVIAYEGSAVLPTLMSWLPVRREASSVAFVASSAIICWLLSSLKTCSMLTASSASSPAGSFASAQSCSHLMCMCSCALSMRARSTGRFAACLWVASPTGLPYLGLNPPMQSGQLGPAPAITSQSLSIVHVGQDWSQCKCSRNESSLPRSPRRIDVHPGFWRSLQTATQMSCRIPDIN